MQVRHPAFRTLRIARSVFCLPQIYLFPFAGFAFFPWEGVDSPSPSVAGMPPAQAWCIWSADVAALVGQWATGVADYVVCCRHGVH